MKYIINGMEYKTIKFAGMTKVLVGTIQHDNTIINCEDHNVEINTIEELIAFAEQNEKLYA